MAYQPKRAAAQLTDPATPIPQAEEEIQETTRRMRLLVVARPKTGKTSSLVSLVNEGGFRLILCDFDGNADPLYNLIDEDKRHLLHVIPFEDNFGPPSMAEGGSIGIKLKGDPKAFSKFLHFLDGKPTRDSQKRMTDFGPAASWGPDTVLVVDSLTALGRACFRRYITAIGRNEQTKRIKDWGVAAGEAESALEMLTSSYYRCHVIVMAHVKMIGPKPLEEDDSKRQDKVDYNNELKKEEAELVPVRLYPIAIGRSLCEHLAEHFPGVVRAEVTNDGKRIFNLRPCPEMDTGLPASPKWLAANKTLPIEDGLMSMMTAVTGLTSAPVLKGSDDETA